MLPDISGARQVRIVVTQPPSRGSERDPKKGSHFSALVNCRQSKNTGLELPEPIWNVHEITRLNVGLDFQHYAGPTKGQSWPIWEF